MAENRKLKVFLCHSKDDKLRVREIYDRLIADGFDAWLDEEKLLPGQEWELEIQKAVRESDVAVVCLSNNSITKAGYIQKEIRFALDVADEQPEGGVYLIPAKLEDCKVPSRLSKWQWVNLFDNQGYKKLKVSLDTRAQKLGIAATFYNSFELSHLPFEASQMVRIPAGEFLMGSTQEQIAKAIKDGADEKWVRAEQPQHEVKLPEYFIGKYPVTNIQYQTFVQDAKNQPPRGWDGESYPPGKSDHPVVNVSWAHAQAYCQWLGQKTGKPYRLPMEAEWEYAARGPYGRTYPWGEGIDKTRTNYNSSDTSPVGSYENGKSSFGVYDMAGNIWEWVADWYDVYPGGDPNVSDNFGKKYRVLRGGAWNYYDVSLRSAFRYWFAPDFRFDFLIGFRVCFAPTLTFESKG
ncbi:MAG: SUMF1/EgtB/PvdO family nonheme iron enzyme [Anaerolineales bacterium]